MKNEKGITLVELLVAVVIAGIDYCSTINSYDWNLYKDSKSRKRNTNCLCCSGSNGEDKIKCYKYRIYQIVITNDRQ